MLSCLAQIEKRIGEIIYQSFFNLLIDFDKKNSIRADKSFVAFYIFFS